VPALWRHGLLAIVALACGGAVFFLSARIWGRTDTRLVRVKFDDRQGPRLLKLEGRPDDRLEYVPAPPEVFRAARPGDQVLCRVRRIPEFEVESAEFRLYRGSQELARWSEGGSKFWIACGGLSLLTGLLGAWILGLAFRRTPTRPTLSPPTRLLRRDELTPFSR